MTTTDTTTRGSVLVDTTKTDETDVNILEMAMTTKGLTCQDMTVMGTTQMELTEPVLTEKDLTVKGTAKLD
jgi:hypothetical protein